MISLALSAALALDLSAPRPPPRDVYRLNLPVDVSVTTLGLAAGLGRIFFADKLIRITCNQSCDPSSVNAIDRSAVGNDNATAALFSHFTVGLSVVAPPLLDLFDVGASRAFGDDLAIFVETMAVNTLLTQV